MIQGGLEMAWIRMKAMTVVGDNAVMKFSGRLCSTSLLTGRHLLRFRGSLEAVLGVLSSAK